MNSSKDNQLSRDPAYAASERLASLLIKQSKDGIMKQLDPSIVYHSLTGTFQGVQAVTKALCRFCELAGSALTLEGTTSYKDLKTASTISSVYGIRVQDTITINHSLLVTKIVRIRIPSTKSLSQQNKLLSKAFLRSLLEGNVPRANQRYPVLDFSYRNIERARDLFLTAPRSGKKHIEPKAKPVVEVLPKTARRVTSEPEEERVVIKGKGRDGEQAAYCFDRKEMNLGKDEKEVDSDEDDTIMSSLTKRDTYEASAVKLCNNMIKSARRLNDALKRLCVNAFYFLTWVDLSFNKLTEIPDFSQFPLIILYLHSNCIQNIGEIRKLTALEDLQSLTLYGNPIQDQIENYKYSVLNLLSDRGNRDFTLKKFDFAVLSERDRANMKTHHDFTVGVSSKEKILMPNL